MARMNDSIRWSLVRRRTRHRVLVVSLLVGRKETTAASAAPGAKTRARSRRIAAAVAALPEEILVWEIFVRLPAKDILGCRAVCRSWRGLTSVPDFLLAHHRRQPSLPLLTLHSIYGKKDDLPLFIHGRPLLGIDEYKGIRLHASCDGLLLVSLSDGRFNICNPTTRQCAPLRCLTTAGYIDIVALYLHRPSGEYRVLYSKGRNYLKAAYYILTARRGQRPRCIGVPSDIPILDIEKVMVASNGATLANLIPPVVFRNGLHWDPNSVAGILVFDTVLESFRLMRRPAAATRLCTRLCDMEGSIGFSCYDDDGRTILKIWVLEDYEREVWSLKYHFKLPVERFYYHEDRQHLVLSYKGDVLVYRPYNSYMIHSDSTGKLVEEFHCNSWDLSIIGHRYKESLVKHDISLRRGCTRIFQRV